MKAIAWIWALLLAQALAGPAGAREPWWADQWAYRRPVSVADIPKTGLEGEEIAVVTMPTGGLMASDGRDIRVVAGGQHLLPHRILMVGPGDQVRLAFTLKAPYTTYCVYFGNAKAERPAEELKIRRGLLLEMWEFKGGPIGSLPLVQQAFARASNLIGRDFRDTIFSGSNPFGPQSQICCLYAGWLNCPQEGEYAFATSSKDASFLLVDDKAVVANGGTHPPQREASQRGKINLTKGLHELKVYHVVTEGDPVVVAAWKSPEAAKLWTIPQEAFAPIRRAKCEAVERYNRDVEVDFIPVHAGETFLANVYLQRYMFEALPAKPPTPPKCQWDFGDGQTATQLKCQHVYLRSGQFKVTLTVQTAGQTLSRTNTIIVSRPWERLTSPELDSLSEHAKIVAGYDMAAADVQDLGMAILLFRRAGNTQALLAAGDALIKREQAPANVLRDSTPVYADALVTDGKDSPRAVAVLLKATEMTRHPGVRAGLVVKAGQLALAAGDQDKALGLFERALKDYSALTTDDAIRLARIGVGDVWRARGDYRKALEAYQAARPVEAAAEKRLLKRGDYARHVEDYIRQKMFNDAADYLERWELEFPIDRLEGFSTLLRARLAMAQKDHAGVIAQAEQLVRVNPQSNYAAELLMETAAAYQATNKQEQAKAAWQQVARNYPESPLAAAAKAKLEGKPSATLPASRPPTRPNSRSSASTRPATGQLQAATFRRCPRLPDCLFRARLQTT